MITSIRLHSVVLILSALFVASAHTRSHAVTEAGAPLLTYPGHPRLVGMGFTGVADNGDPSTVYYNPANTVAEPRAYLTGSKMEWPDDWFSNDMWVGRVNGGLSWQSGDNELTWGVDVGLGEFNYGESIATLPDGTPLGTYESFERVTSLAIAAGIPFGDRCEARVGVAGKRWWTKLAPAQFTQDPVQAEFDAFAFDAGLTVGIVRASNDWKLEPALGVAIVDAGGDYETMDGYTDPLPTRLNFGANLWVEGPTLRMLDADVPVLTVSTNLDGTDQRHGGLEWGAGTELAVAQVLFLRGGLNKRDKEDAVWSGWGIGVGLPVSSLRLRFDYTQGEYYYDTHTTHMGVTASWLF